MGLCSTRGVKKIVLADHKRELGGTFEVRSYTTWHFTGFLVPSSHPQWRGGLSFRKENSVQAQLQLVKTSDQVATLPLKEFAARFAVVLPKLIRVLKRELSSHSVWGRLIPYGVESYGDQESLGHIVRPDIILTEEGVRICELDFVPLGRGMVVSSLPQERREAFLKPFVHWYQAMGLTHVALGLATGYLEPLRELECFAGAFNALESGVSVTPVNVDETLPSGLIVDRMFVRSEMKKHWGQLEGTAVFSAEPFLDSKAVFAAVHAPDAEEAFLQYMSRSDLDYLRMLMPETHSLELLRHQQSPILEVVAGHEESRQSKGVARRREWLLKNSDVETDTCWGSRGVVLGTSFGETHWVNALNGVNPKSKDLGRHPLLQRFTRSMDFKPMWDAIVRDEIVSVRPEEMGRGEDDVVRQLATRHVYARLGAYFLVENSQGTVRVPPYGIATMRQDELAHGAKDAQLCAFELV